MDLIKIKSEVSKKLNEDGYSLYSLREYNSKNGLTLEIIVDRYEPINLDDIVNISHTLSDLLDKIDDSNTPYTLDISSLGAEKPIEIKDLKKYQGKYVNIHLLNPFKGLNTLEGDLIEVSDTEATISYKEKTRTIKAKVLIKDIDKARLTIKF